MSRRASAAISAAPLIFLLSAATVRAQTVADGSSPAGQSGPATANVLDEVIVTGSRQSGLKAADSPAPVQIIERRGAEDGRRQSRPA